MKKLIKSSDGLGVVILVCWLIVAVVGIVATAIVETKKYETHLTTPQPCVE